MWGVYINKKRGWGRGGVGTYSKTPDRGGVGGGGFLRGDLRFRHSRGGLDLKGGVDYSRYCRTLSTVLGMKKCVFYTVRYCIK